jgi:hypothetical protein
MKLTVNRKGLLRTSAVILIAIAIWNYPCHYRMGINGEVSEKEIPLYAKACGFLYRDWAYKDIVRNILATGAKSDTEKAVAILKWTHENVTGRIPEGIKVVDDHPLNIIIRQYGTGDQIEDVFTILCSYAGMRAGMAKCYDKERTAFKIFSVVQIDGRWLIFIAGENMYFLNKEGRIGSVEDYLNGDIVLSDEARAEYSMFLDGLKDARLSSLTRADEQMPLRRIPTELKKAFTRGRVK